MARRKNAHRFVCSSRNGCEGNMRYRRLAWMAGMAVAALGPLRSATAQVSQWIGGSSDWNTPTNWSPSGVPGGTEVRVTSTLGLTQTITYDYPGSSTLQVLVVDLTGGSGGAGEILSMSANNLATLPGGSGESIGDSEFDGGSGGVGTFHQSGGINTTSSLFLGYNSTDTGYYNLSGTGSLVDSFDETVGEHGTGVFTQSGGTNTAFRFDLGVFGGSTGTYTLCGTGSLTASNSENIGFSGSGTFNQTGGSNTLSGSGVNLTIAESPGETSMYTLSATGSLSVGGTEVVAYGGAGTFIQSGGTNTTGALVLGSNTYAGSTGTYTLSGTGSLTTTGNETIGASFGGTGNFNESGGTNTMGGLVISTGSNIYTLNGGTINAEALNFNGGPSDFNWTSGTLNLTSSVTFDPSGSTTTGKAFGSSLTVGTNQTLIVTGNETLGGTGPFSLTLNSGGTHSVTGTLTVNPKGTLTQNGGSLSAAMLNGNFTQSGGIATFGQITGTSKLAINGGQTTLTLNGGVSQVGSLSMTGLGTLDITNNKLFIDYGTGPDPIASIEQWIKNGFYGLPGPQIISSAIAADDVASGLSYGIGYADGADGEVAGLPSGEIEIMFTLLGDANLDGTVNSEDFTLFAEHLGQSGMMWDEGDFNYDGTVNAEDFTLFSANLNQSASLAAAAGVWEANSISLANVPEPMSAGIIGMAGSAILRRRRRSSR
jgi:hypothetical protein